MGRFSIVTCTDGNYIVRSEWGDKESAFKAFHALCAALYNDTSIRKGMVKVLDENLDTVGKMEYIEKEIPVEQTPAEPTE